MARSDSDVRILVTPVRTADPTGATDWHERRSLGGSRTHVRTVDGLAEAVRAATNRTWQLDPRAAEDTGRSIAA